MTNPAKMGVGTDYEWTANYTTSRGCHCSGGRSPRIFDFWLMSSNWNPRGDWELPLCNGYYIFRTSSRDICVVHERDNYKDLFENVIDAYITCFQYNSRYIAVRRLVVADRALLDDIQSVDTEAADYYLIDAETDTIYGPFAEKEDFERACKEQNVGDLGEWIPTVPAPEGAEF